MKLHELDRKVRGPAPTATSGQVPVWPHFPRYEAEVGEMRRGENSPEQPPARGLCVRPTGPADARIRGPRNPRGFSGPLDYHLGPCICF